MSVWDSCHLQQEEQGFLASYCKTIHVSSSSSSSHSAESRTEGQVSTVGNDDDIEELELPVVTESNVDSLQQSLEAAELSCRTFRQELDSILYTLGEVSVEFNDVTGRTNNLMLNCEALLEKQHSLELTVGKLRTCLKPFEDVEIIARSLGIPLDTQSSKSNSSNTGNSSLAATGAYKSSGSRGGGGSGSGSGSHVISDPRSAEFKELLVRMAASHKFLDEHREYMDSDKYHHWVIQLRGRAISLVARAMRSLLEGATRQAADTVSTLTSDSSSRFTPMAALATKMLIDDSPIEGASLYRKFRGLGFRLKELAGLLQPPRGAGATAGADTSEELEEDHATLDEVKQAYIGMRQQLLVPFVHALSIAKPVNTKNLLAPPPATSSSTSNIAVTKARSQLTLPGRDNNLTLCPAIHHAYSMLLRVCQLEQQLFTSLFCADDEEDTASTFATVTTPTTRGANAASVSSPSTPYAGNASNAIAAPPQTPGTTGTPALIAKAKSHHVTPAEVLTIIGSLCNTICDGLRPLIIHENDVDELCRVAGTLADDIRSQIANMRAPIAIQRALEAGMERTICDTQERLSYVAEIQLRQEVQSFKPTPAQLAYPDILEAALMTSSAPASADSTTGTEQLQQQQQQQQESDFSSTWYPPLRQTLALLSKLYGVVETTVFEDFARRTVHQCVVSLRIASESVARSRSVLHGDLFLVRHLLILREQLLPFDARLTGTERSLDFRSTGAAWTHFASNARSLLKFDMNNSLWQLAKEGLPGLQEDNVDAKRELDAILKAACSSLKINAVRMLLSGLDGWIAKITACIGDIPITHDNTSNIDKSRLVASANAPPSLPADHIALLRGQAFLRPQRVLEVLNEAQTSAASGVAELRAIMKLYVDNTIARTILMKPVQQEVEAVRRKVETILASCVDAGQPRRDLEQLIAAIALTVDTNLLQQ